MGTELQEKVWELVKANLEYKKLVDQVAKGLIRRYWIDDGLCMQVGVNFIPLWVDLDRS